MEAIEVSSLLSSLQGRGGGGINLHASKLGFTLLQPELARGDAQLNVSLANTGQSDTLVQAGARYFLKCVHSHWSAEALRRRKTRSCSFTDVYERSLKHERPRAFKSFPKLLRR